jgi:hypothetical protein
MAQYDYDDDSADQLQIKNVFSRAWETLTQLTLVVVVLTMVGEALGFIGSVINIMEPLLRLVGGLVSMCMQGAVALVIYKSYHEEEPVIPECLNQSLSRIGTMLLLVLIMILIMIGAAIPIGIVYAIASKIFEGLLGAIIIILVSIGIFLYVFATFGMAIPSCVVQGLGAMDSLRNSLALTKGNKLRIMGVYFIVGFIAFLVVSVSYGLALSLVESSNSPAVQALNLSGEGHWAGILGKFEALDESDNILVALLFGLTGLITQLVGNVVNGSMYLELILTKSNQDIDSMAEVFE